MPVNKKIVIVGGVATGPKAASSGPAFVAGC